MSGVHNKFILFIDFFFCWLPKDISVGNMILELGFLNQKTCLTLILQHFFFKILKYEIWISVLVSVLCIFCRKECAWLLSNQFYFFIAISWNPNSNFFKWKKVFLKRGVGMGMCEDIFFLKYVVFKKSTK